MGRHRSNDHATQAEPFPNRGFRVADQIQRDLAELMRELKDPRVGMVTIKRVELTPDYAHAKVFFTMLDRRSGNEMRGGAEQGGRLHLRNGLFKRLHIHTVPTLHFQYDRTTERAAELTALIDEGERDARARTTES